MTAARVILAIIVVALAGIHDDGEPSWGPHVVVALTPPPDRTPIPEAASTTPIKHVVFLVKENRTYDNLFGLFPGGDGTSYGVLADGSTVPLRPVPDKQTDLQHSYFAAHHDINGGRMNGFSTLEDKSGNVTNLAFTTAQPGQLPAYWGWARHYELMDHMFSSAASSSMPNRLYSIAGSSAGVIDGPNFRTTRWGCDDPAGITAPAIRHGKLVRVRPCFNIPTTAGLLQDKGLQWAYYGARGGELGYGWVAVDQIRYIRDTDSWEKHVFPIEWFTHDVSQGYLAPVTWIAPPFNLSDHPGGPSLCQGHNWTVGIVNAIMRSPLWRSTAIVLTWDDFGGFYDHVPPPRADFLGTRPARAARRHLAVGPPGRRQHGLRLHVRPSLHRRGLRPAPPERSRRQAGVAAVGLPVREAAAAVVRETGIVPGHAPGAPRQGHRRAGVGGRQE